MDEEYLSEDGQEYFPGDGGDDEPYAAADFNNE